MERTGRSKNLAATTKNMRDIAREAHKLGLNRQMKPAQFKLLDPRGTHIITPQFYHDKANGKPVEWHCRCHIHLKLLGKQKAVELVMDIPDHFLADYLTIDEHRELVERGKESGAIKRDENDPEPEALPKVMMKVDEIKEGNEATPNADNMSAEGKA